MLRGCLRLSHSTVIHSYFARNFSTPFHACTRACTVCTTNVHETQTTSPQRRRVFSSKRNIFGKISPDDSRTAIIIQRVIDAKFAFAFQLFPRPTEISNRGESILANAEPNRRWLDVKYYPGSIIPYEIGRGWINCTLLMGVGSMYALNGGTDVGYTEIKSLRECNVGQRGRGIRGQCV